MIEELPFLPGAGRLPDTPLARFLPPVPPGSAARWLDAHVPPGGRVLDPFGASPDLALEIARSGRQVLVAANNPIVRFLLEQLAAKPGEMRLTAALAHLAAARVGEERLEPHLLAMYYTPCGACGSLVSAAEFLWERDAETPFARRYDCPNCGRAGEYPATPYDADLAKKTAATRLNTARILERVAALSDPDRRHAEEALQHYPPRAITALGILVNKLDTFDPGDFPLLSALMLVTFDRCNTLWPYPNPRPRPRQLTIPPKYRERNVFYELEKAVGAWAGGDADIPLTSFPALPEGAGICIYEGPIRDLADHLPAFDIQAVVTALPRPNQAFWKLSALWAGWLGGREAVKPFKPVLRRDRYDWRWHATALHAALAHLVPRLAKDTPVLALIPEAVFGFLGAGLTAGKAAGLELRSLAIRAEDEIAQAHWRVGRNPKRPPPAEEPVQAAAQAARSYLARRGEPSPLLPILGAVFDPAARALTAEGKDETHPADTYAQLTTALENALTYRSGFLRYNAGKELDIGQWWLREPPPGVSLSDRLETFLIDHLKREPGHSLQEIDTAICAAFPGLFTPDGSLVAACVESYGRQIPGDGWHLREEDNPDTRNRDHKAVRQLLTDLGGSLKFHVTGDQPVTWTDNQAVFHFYITTTAQAGRILQLERPTGGKNLIVLPGSRSNLLLHKRSSDPRLDYDLREWHFLKFRQLRAMAANPLLNRANLDEYLLMDELTYESPQLKLF